ncbi:MAG: DUF3301 domain-containing protein [Wenzhouxiangella sp.]|nr:DUF3301 domain-containing protein [Wenzhouxiangella sp.]MCH8476685.1 DUF3301 domain-containing protein [Wenzhouxiangella sp.]TVR96000.1 MAG: DUF3301 domain-containing protein [Wenzhouxiangellaceae bacterium]
MDGAIVAFLVLGAVALWWHWSLQAREAARHHARAFCQRQGWQLLDQTVALGALWPVRDGDHLRLRRIYGFDFSPDGGARRHADLVMIGPRLVQISAELEDGGRLIE